MNDAAYTTYFPFWGKKKKWYICLPILNIILLQMNLEHNFTQKPNCVNQAGLTEQVPR